MIGKKMATWTLSLLGALALASAPALAGDKNKKAPEVEVAVPQVQTQVAPAPAHHTADTSSMSILLDGVLYPLSAMKDIQGELSIIIDDEALKTGVGRAYRTRAEFDAYAASTSASCQEPGASLDTTSQCLFYDGSNCTFTRRLAVNCGFAVTNVNSLLTVASFSLGCGTTFVCPATDCSGTCALVTGTAGTCINVTGPVGCAGCANF